MKREPDVKDSEWIIHTHTTRLDLFAFSLEPLSSIPRQSSRSRCSGERGTRRRMNKDDTLVSCSSSSSSRHHSHRLPQSSPAHRLNPVTSMTPLPLDVGARETAMSGSDVTSVSGISCTERRE